MTISRPERPEDPSDPAPAPTSTDRAGRTNGTNRATAVMSVLTAVSRLSGLARGLVVLNVLGDSFLGNTYQSANTVPNVVFELLAAGALQGVLVPAFVELVDAGKDSEVDDLSGAIFGTVATVLGVFAAVGMVLAPWIMGGLTSQVADPALRAAENRLGTLLLIMFLPQMVFYAANLVATAGLNARRHFAIPAVAPLFNNVVVIGAYLTFDRMRGSQPPSLDLTTAERLVLGGGTTLGVIVFCAVPVFAARRHGFSMRPRLGFRRPEVWELLRQGAWAAGFLACTQVLLVVVIVLANPVEGAYQIWQLAWQVFMLPHSLLAVPILTTRFPEVARAARLGDRRALVAEVASGMRGIVACSLLAAVLLGVANVEVARVFPTAGTRAGPGPIGAAFAAFGPALLGFGLLMFLARVCYATGDARTPTMVNLVVTLVAGVAMVVFARVFPDRWRVAALAGGFSVGNLVGGGLLGVIVWSRTLRAEGLRGEVAAWARRIVGAALAGGAGAAIVGAIPSGGWATSAATLVGVGALGSAVFLATVALSGGASPLQMLRSFGCAEPEPDVRTGGSA